MTLPASAAELAAYLIAARELHLHQGGCGWRVTFLETDKCGTTDCLQIPLKNIKLPLRETETPRG